MDIPPALSQEWAQPATKAAGADGIRQLMSKIETWNNLPVAVREYLIEQMRDRLIIVADLNQLRLWIDTKPEVPEGDWYKGFGCFKICGQGPCPKTFLLRGQVAQGSSI